MYRGFFYSISGTTSKDVDRLAVVLTRYGGPSCFVERDAEVFDFRWQGACKTRSDVSWRRIAGTRVPAAHVRRRTAKTRWPDVVVGGGGGGFTRCRPSAATYIIVFVRANYVVIAVDRRPGSSSSPATTRAALICIIVCRRSAPHEIRGGIHRRIEITTLCSGN